MDFFDDEKDENYYKPIDGQMRYDELLLPEEEKEEEKVDNVVLDGQLDIWSIKPQKEKKVETKINEKEKFEKTNKEIDIDKKLEKTKDEQ